MLKVFPKEHKVIVSGVNLVKDTLSLRNIAKVVSCKKNCLFIYQI